MKLRKNILRKLDNNSGWGLIMRTLDCSPTTARDYVKNNSENLTKKAMLLAIQEEFGLSESEILEEVKGVTK